MSSQRTVAIIPNRNGAGRLERCQATLSAQRGAALEAVAPEVLVPEVVVVDNASSDGSPEAATRAGARVLRFPENRGFAAAVNHGVAESDSEFVALVNNDVELEPDWLSCLLAAMRKHPECGMVTGRTLQRGSRDSRHSNATLDGTGDAISLGLAAVRLGFGCPDGPAYRQERPVLAVSGAASLIRREVFRRIGGFEEAFFAYLEDVDFCLRAQLAGFQARYVPEAVAWHEGSATTAGQAGLPLRVAPDLHPQVAIWLTAHQLLLAARYARWGTLHVLLPRVLLVQALWAARLVLAGRLRPWLRGLVLAAAGWRRLRSWTFPPEAGPRRLVKLLRASETQIYADCGRRDTFWRLYFRLFRPPAGEASLQALGPDRAGSCHAKPGDASRRYAEP